MDEKKDKKPRAKKNAAVIIQQIVHVAPDRQRKDVGTLKQALERAESVILPNRYKLYDLYHDVVSLDGHLSGVLEPGKQLHRAFPVAQDFFCCAAPEQAHKIGKDVFVLRVLHELKKGNDKLNLDALHDCILGFRDRDVKFTKRLHHVLACRILPT